MHWGLALSEHCPGVCPTLITPQRGFGMGRVPGLPSNPCQAGPAAGAERGRGPAPDALLGLSQSSWRDSQIQQIPNLFFRAPC